MTRKRFFVTSTILFLLFLLELFVILRPAPPAPEPEPVSIQVRPTVVEPAEPSGSFADAMAKVEVVKPKLEPGHKWVPRIAVRNTRISEDTAKGLYIGLNRLVAAGADTILFEIDSPGGSVDDGLAMARIIENAPVPIVCVVDGRAESMAYYLLQSCDVRLMTTRSFLMVHYARRQGAGNVMETEAENNLNFLRAVDKAMLAQYTHRLSVDTAYVHARIHDGHEWYLNADEAKRVGAIDDVSAGVEATQVQLSVP